MSCSKDNIVNASYGDIWNYAFNVTDDATRERINLDGALVKMVVYNVREKTGRGSLHSERSG